MKAILAEQRGLRFLSFTVFYIAQGLPFGLVSYAIPAFLAENGASAGEIGAFIALASLPWSFKLIAGPLMDRFNFLAMGRRRPWVILTQLGLVLTGLTFAFFPEGLNDLRLLTWLCFLLNVFAATQDVAVDGMAIDVLPVEEQGRANAFMALGQVVGISGAGAAAAFLIKSHGMIGVSLLLALGFSFILAWSLAVRERDGEKLLPWTEGAPTTRSLALQPSSWREIIVNLSRVLLLPASILLMGVSFIFRYADGFWITLAPVIVVQDLGFSSTDYASFTSLASLLAAFGGLLVGLFIDKVGVKTLYMLSLAGYALLAFVVGSFPGAWESIPFLVSIGFLQAFLYQGGFVSFIAVHMNLCWVKVAATQFALYMAWINVGRSAGAGSLAFLEDKLTNPQMLQLIGLVFVVGMGLLWRANLQAHQKKVATLDAI
jgi:PAT family beta-lactamase induction signal transducer AmpG